MNKNLMGILALIIVVVIVAIIAVFSAGGSTQKQASTELSSTSPLNPYLPLLTPSNFSIANIVNLQNKEFGSINSVNLTFLLLIRPYPAHIFGYQLYGYDSKISIPYNESVIELAKSSNGTYISNNYISINYTSVYKIGNEFYGCSKVECFNATSLPSVQQLYQYLAILNLSVIDGLNKTYVISLANVHQATYNGYPCTYLSILGTNSSQQYQDVNVSMCLSSVYHIPVQLSYTASNDSSETIFLNFTAVSVNDNVLPSQVTLPLSVNSIT